MAKRTQKFTDTIETGFIKVPEEILQLDLTIAAFKVYLYLLNNTAEWVPSIRQIMKATKLSNAAVQRGLDLLEEKRLIKVIPGDNATKNKYKFTRWFENPLYSQRVHPCTHNEYTPVLTTSTPPVLTTSTLPEEGYQKSLPDKKSQTAITKIIEDSCGQPERAVSKKRSTEELMKDAIKEEEMRIALDRDFQEAKRR